MAEYTYPTEQMYSPPSSVVKYPNQFLDIASTKLPKSIKDLFVIAEHYFFNHGLIASALTKQATYPITSLVYDVRKDDQAAMEKWKELLEERLDFPEILITINKNYLTYGNCFISLQKPIKKEVTCGNCGFKTEFRKANYVIQDNKIVLKQCPGCGMLNPQTKITDTYIKDVNKLRLRLWNPNRMGIRYNNLTGKTVYEYDISADDRERIKTLKMPPDELCEIEQIYIDTALDPITKVVVFSEDAIYHFKASSLAGFDPAWGFPTMLSLAKDLYYLQTIKKANEAVMMGHMVPFRYLFPKTPAETGIPFGGVNLATWKGFMQKEVSRWIKDPNYIGIFPFEAGNGTIGGQGRSLLSQQEMNEMAKYILAGLGVPYEFLFGGLQWSGTNVSLRMLENEFIRIRKQNLKLVNFIIKSISDWVDGYFPIKVHFSEFKMADDIQRKQELINLYNLSLISMDTLLQEFGFDSSKEIEKRKGEITSISELRKKEMLAKINLDMAAQEEQQKKQIEMQKSMGQQMEQTQQQVGAGEGEGKGQGQEVNQAAAQEQQKQQKPLPEQKPPRGANSSV